MSSKHPTPVPLLATSLLPPRSLQPRDPRFSLPESSFSAAFNHRAAYSFLTALQREELQQLRKDERKVKSSQRKEEIRREADTRAARLKEQDKKDREAELLRGWRKEEMRRRREEGKAAFHLKAADAKKVKLAAEFVRMREMGQEGSIRRKLEKKRKQRMTADQRSMRQSRARTSTRS